VGLYQHSQFAIQSGRGHIVTANVEDVAGQRLGKYELQAVLGKGGSGTVYLALDTFSGQQVALKVLDPDLVTHPEFGDANRRQFMNEASLAGKLQHPHIAAILEASMDEVSGYIAVEYVAGGSLTKYTQPGNLLPIPEVLEIAFKCCGALDYAFKQGIIHRDINPANLMLAEGTAIKVADFGAALLKRTEITQISDVGTPLYMSPEQIRSGELNHQSDMFALGIVLYELFTGARPFSGSSLPEVFARILEAKPVPPSQLRPELGPEIDRIVLRMLQQIPPDRYPSWADLALDLAGIGRLSVYQQAVPDTEKFMALRKFKPLELLGEAEIWELVHGSTWRRLPPQSVVMREDSEGCSLLFLASGELKITKGGRLLNLLRTGEYFGEMAYVKAGAIRRQATVESITDVVVAEFEPASIERLSKTCQLQLSQALLHTLVDRLAMADERISIA
jgi:serine/threonine protein kinase